MQTVDTCNRHAEQGRDPLFHKQAKFIVPLRKVLLKAYDLSTNHVFTRETRMNRAPPAQAVHSERRGAAAVCRGLARVRAKREYRGRPASRYAGYARHSTPTARAWSLGIILMLASAGSAVADEPIVDEPIVGDAERGRLAFAPCRTCHYPEQGCPGVVRHISAGTARDWPAVYGCACVPTPFPECARSRTATPPRSR